MLVGLLALFSLIACSPSTTDTNPYSTLQFPSELRFGMSAEEVQAKYQTHYDPWFIYNMNQEVRMALTSLIDGTFDQNTDLFRELYDALLNGCGGRADEYFVLEDYADYARAQWDIDRAYRDQTKWAKMAIVNVAKSGKFSSDRTIRQYAEEIWDLKPLHIED